MNERKSDNTTIETIPIKRIKRDFKYQIRMKTEASQVSQYAKMYRNGTELDPVTVLRTEKNKNILIDGWHRVAAQESIGRKTVKAVVIPGTEDEALYHAGEMNLRHGLQIKKSEIKRFFEGYMKVGKNSKDDGTLKSYREIQADLHGRVSHGTVVNWMRELYPDTAKAMGKGEDEGKAGKVRTSGSLDSGASETVIFALKSALEGFKDIKDPVEKGKIVQYVTWIQDTMNEGGPWPVPEEEF